MQSVGRPAQPCRPWRRGGGPNGAMTAEPKAPQGGACGFRREDRNMNTVAASSPRRLNKDPPSRTTTRAGVQPRVAAQSRLGLHKQPASAAPPSNRGKFKPRIARGSGTTAPKAAAAAAKATGRAPARATAPQPPLPPLPSISASPAPSSPLLALDANCNEPSLPCLCCDGRSPQDSNSMFNHNHNNNNAVSIRRQLRLQLPPAPPPLPQRHDGKGGGGGGEAKVKGQQSPASSSPQSRNPQEPSDSSGDLLKEQGEEEKEAGRNDVDNKNVHAKEEDEEEEEEEESSSAEISDSIDDEVDDDDDEDDDDTLVPSCCDCPPSLLDFSLTSSTSSSSSSTSISSCSDLESDCADLSSSCHDLEELSNSAPPLATQERHSPASLPLKLVRTPPSRTTTISASTSPMPACSPDEGYPSAPGSPASSAGGADYLGVKGHATGHMGSEVTRLGLLDFLESLGEFGKMERFSQVVQVARWDLEQQWEILRDRLDHLDRLEKVNRQVRLVHVARLHEKGLDLRDLERDDLEDFVDEMGNIDIPWKLYRGRGGALGDSQEFSDDGGVDLTAPSDCDEPLAPDSLTPSPADALPPGRPPKPPARTASVTSDLHDCVNISRETSSIAISASPTAATFSAFSPRSPTASPTFSTFRCEKPPPQSPPLSVPPLSLSQPPPVPYFTLFEAPPVPPSLPPAPPVPPPRRRHLARKEAQRLAALQAARQEASPLSLPPPSTRPPPLPPPPVISVSSVASPPPAVPPPPSFHALDVEIRKLLMLAGLTQAELLRLSPELGGVCAMGGLEEETKAHAAPSARPDEVRLTEDEDEEEREEEERCDVDEEVAADGWRSGRDGEEKRGTGEGEEAKKKKREETATSSAVGASRTTSFGELARRRKRNGGLTSDLYYSTAAAATSPPPPPPPRPLPPVPRAKVCSVSANAARPERFDWLIAFTPDAGEAAVPPPQLPRRPAPSPPNAARRTSDAPPPKVPQRPAPSPPQTKTRTSSSSSSSPPLPPPSHSSSSSSLSSTGSKVTTFKEMRLRSKSSGTSENLTVITDPDPDPSIMTPDPDILYNLRWRRETQGGDGSQWEYTSLAQEVMGQPLPTLTSLDALREMLRRDEEKQEVRATLWNDKEVRGASGRGGTLWNDTTGPEQQGGVEEEKQTKWRKEEEEEEKKEEEEKEVEVRGRADGGRTLESRSTASSSPLPPSLSSPYFLHSAQRRYDPHPQPADPRPPNLPDPRPLNHVGSGGGGDPPYSARLRRDPGSENAASRGGRGHAPASRGAIGRGNDDAADSEADAAAFDYDFLSESLSHFDSLYFDESPGGRAAAAAAPPAPVNAAAPPSPSCSTPYKNVDAMLSFSTALSATDSLYAADKRTAANDPGGYVTRASKALPPLPTCYLYHPKNCPLHRGAPPRLSPIGALSPPLRSGAPPPGTEGSRLGSPLFPRSHTLPALAAPLYYPYLYPPLPPPPLPPKNLCQATTTTTTTTTTAAAATALQPRALTVRSVSFAGSVQRGGTSWMGEEDVHIPMRGLMSSLCPLQDKKALVSAVSVAVEAILAQFSSSRTVVQKALSGDSSVNPSLGRVVVQCLCPALWSLLSDGLKPHQSDLIAGRRPNSAWGLVQASTKPGPSTQGLYSLQVRVASLPQLKQSKHRFNAFLLGLLNTKSLDLWLSHLQSCSDVLETFYHPCSFVRLSSCQSLFEEVLLLLQPLSLLTFNLDLLFQHHHHLVEPANRSPEVPQHSPPPTANSQEAGLIRPTPPRVADKGSLSKARGGGGAGYLESLSELDFGRPETKEADSNASSSPLADPMEEAPGKLINGDAGFLKPRPVSLGQTSPQLMWVQEKHFRDIAPPVVEEVSLTQQAEQVLQQGWGAMVRWGGRLGQNLTELGLYGAQNQRTGGGGLSELHGPPGSDFPRVDSGGAVPWGLGRFFGASKHPISPLSVHHTSARRPSEWIAPGVTALTRMVSSTSTPMLRRALEPLGESYYADREPESLEMTDKPRALRSVRTLCDHSGTGEEELSFHKGEELEVLGGVDHDWIRCRRGDKEGLVPIGYASLIM